MAGVKCGYLPLLLYLEATHGIAVAKTLNVIKTINRSRQ
jgi:hypothetical protein